MGKEAENWNGAEVGEEHILHADHFLVDIRADRLYEMIGNEASFGKCIFGAETGLDFFDEELNDQGNANFKGFSVLMRSAPLPNPMVWVTASIFISSLTTSLSLAFSFLCAVSS